MVRLQKESGYAIIILPSLLYFDHDLVRIRDELTDLSEEIEADDEIRAVLLTAEEKLPDERGKTLREILIAMDGLPIERIRFSEIFRKIDRPVVAAIPKGAWGPGAELILWCDIRMASYESTFCFPHVLEGLTPWDGATQRLPRIVGMSSALELLLTGKVVDANEAERIGLVNRVVEREKLLEEAIDIVNGLLNKSPTALRFIREAVCEGVEIPMNQALRMEGDLYLLLYTTKDREEGIKAFRERRKPYFSGK